jgi:hypothetical protein
MNELEIAQDNYRKGYRDGYKDGSTELARDSNNGRHTRQTTAKSQRHWRSQKGWDVQGNCLDHQGGAIIPYKKAASPQHQMAPWPTAPEPALPGKFQYWSGRPGWSDYDCTEHQVALTNAWDKHMSEVCANIDLPPKTLDLHDEGWLYKITLGELCQPPGGHMDIVGYQIAVTPSGQQHPIRWVRRVGATNSDKLLIMNPAQICGDDCRPPDMASDAASGHAA